MHRNAGLLENKGMSTVVEFVVGVDGKKQAGGRLGA